MNEKNQYSGIIIFCTTTRNFLCVKRSDRVGSLENLWSIPAGQIEFGESPEECALRELNEETQIDLGLVIAVRRLVQLSAPDGNPFHLFLGYVEEEVVPILDLEHTEYRWCKALPSPSVNNIDLIMRQIQEHYGKQ